jgi:AraC family transcriptional regulator
MRPKIIEKPEFWVVGQEISFIHALSPDANNSQRIGSLWDEFAHRAKEVPNRTGQEMYGVIYGRPETQRSHPDELQYIAAVSVREPTKIPVGMTAHAVPAGTFAVFLHHGPISRIAETCREIYRDWLPQSDWLHGGADVEVYDERFKCDSENSEMEYWIAVIPKTRGAATQR